VRHLLVSWAAIAALLPAGGCVRYPADYSSHYQAVSLGPPATRGGRERLAVVPDACLVAEPTDVKLDQGRLPPGCANAHNLLELAERKGDLVHGRPLGPASAGPAARATERYSDGEDRPAVGGTDPSVKGRGNTQEENVPAPRTKNAPADIASTSR